MSAVMLPMKRLLVPVCTAWAVLACTCEDDVTALVEEGKLRGFNIARRQSRRDCLRIYVPSLVDHVAGRRHGEDVSNAIAKVLPGQSAMISGASLARALLCSRLHVKGLLLTGEIDARWTPGRGPNGSPQIPRSAINQFLKERWV